MARRVAPIGLKPYKRGHYDIAVVFANEFAHHGDNAPFVRAVHEVVAFLCFAILFNLLFFNPLPAP